MPSSHMNSEHKSKNDQNVLWIKKLQSNWNFVKQLKNGGQGIIVGVEEKNLCEFASQI